MGKPLQCPSYGPEMLREFFFVVVFFNFPETKMVSGALVKLGNWSVRPNGTSFQTSFSRTKNIIRPFPFDLKQYIKPPVNPFRRLLLFSSPKIASTLMYPTASQPPTVSFSEFTFLLQILFFFSFQNKKKSLLKDGIWSHPS